MKYWEIIADNLSKAGWSWGCVSAIDSNGRTIWIADAHRDDGKRFVIGHLDDAVIIPALVFVALRFVPREVVSEHREQVIRDQATRSGRFHCAPVR